MIVPIEGGARMAQLMFSEADQQSLHEERVEHLHPRVQQRMEVLWLISQGLAYPEAARLAGVSEATVDRYVGLYRQGGIEADRQLNWGKFWVRGLMKHRDGLEVSFAQNRTQTWAEAVRSLR